jgi:outer membrane biosynthesis protein TonB
MHNIPLLISLVLHGLIIILACGNFGDMFSTKIKDSGYAVFDFVEIGEKSKAPVLSRTNGKLSKTQSQAEETGRPQLDRSEPVKESKPKPEEHEPAEDKKKEPEPEKEEPPKPVDDPKAVAIDEAKKPEKEQPKKKAAEPAAKKPVKKPDTNKNKKPSKPKSNSKAVVNLQQNKRRRDYDPKLAKKSLDSLLTGALADGDNANEGINAEEVGETLTATQIDLIRQTIRKCWYFPAGLENAEDLVVDVEMELSKEGKVVKAKVVDQGRMNHDSNFKIAAESALRAVMDPDCNHFQLPEDKYNEWKDITLSFNPKDMLLAE